MKRHDQQQKDRGISFGGIVGLYGLFVSGVVAYVILSDEPKKRVRIYVPEVVEMTALPADHR